MKMFSMAWSRLAWPPKTDGAFGEGAGGGHDRLLVVPRQRAAMVGAAALRAMAVRQAAVNAERGIHGADGLAGLGRVDRQRLALRDFRGVCLSSMVISASSARCSCGHSLAD